MDMTSYKIVVQRSAQNDLHGAWEYIAIELREPAIAARVLNKLEQAIMSLSEMPHRYAALADKLLKSKEIRRLPVENYLVFYIVQEDTKTVSVLRVLHGRRDWEAVL